MDLSSRFRSRCDSAVGVRGLAIIEAVKGLLILLVCFGVASGHRI
jgi:hypothetical protein